MRRGLRKQGNLTSGDKCQHDPESVTDDEKHTDGSLACSRAAHSTTGASWCPCQLGLPCALAAPGAHGARCPPAGAQALLGALPPLFGGGQLPSCELTAHPQACMSAASCEQLQRSWSCHAAPASLWRCQPWLTAPAALARASLPAVTRSLADRPEAAAAAALMSHHSVPEAAATDDSGVTGALLQAAAAVHV